MSDYLDHARRHLPGGSDPLPAATGSRMWPMAYDSIKYSNCVWGLDYDSIATDLTSPGPTAFNTATLDSTYFNGWYYTRGSNVNHACFLQYFRLGPKGSVWGIVGVAENGPDCGKITFGWQTMGEDDQDTGLYLSGEGFLPGSTQQPNYTTPSPDLIFYKGDSPTVDLYNAVQSKAVNFGANSQFRITGDDGARNTANVTSHANNNGWKNFDGGAGIWVLRVVVDGKNGSSSGYKARLSELRVVRFTDDGFPAC